MATPPDTHGSETTTVDLRVLVPRVNIASLRAWGEKYKAMCEEAHRRKDLRVGAWLRLLAFDIEGHLLQYVTERHADAEPLVGEAPRDPRELQALLCQALAAISLLHEKKLRHFQLMPSAFTVDRGRLRVAPPSPVATTDQRRDLEKRSSPETVRDAERDLYMLGLSFLEAALGDREFSRILAIGKLRGAPFEELFVQLPSPLRDALAWLLQRTGTGTPVTARDVLDLFETRDSDQFSGPPSDRRRTLDQRAVTTSKHSLWLGTICVFTVINVYLARLPVETAPPQLDTMPKMTWGDPVKLSVVEDLLKRDSYLSGGQWRPMDEKAHLSERDRACPAPPRSEGVLQSVSATLSRDLAVQLFDLAVRRVGTETQKALVGGIDYSGFLTAMAGSGPSLSTMCDPGSGNPILPLCPEARWMSAALRGKAGRRPADKPCLVCDELERLVIAAHGQVVAAHPRHLVIFDSAMTSELEPVEQWALKHFWNHRPEGQVGAVVLVGRISDADGLDCSADGIAVRRVHAVAQVFESFGVPSSQILRVSLEHRVPRLSVEVALREYRLMPDHPLLPLAGTSLADDAVNSSVAVVLLAPGEEPLALGR